MGVYLAFKHDMRLWGLWMGLTVALVFTSAIGSLIVLWTDWDREVEKVAETLEDDRKLCEDGEPSESV